MFKIKRALSLALLLSTLFTSCNPFSTKEEQDFSKLYLGSYKTVACVDMEDTNKVQLYDYYMYIRFHSKDDEFFVNEDFSYDLEIDLNTSGLENLSINEECSFIELSDKFKNMNQWNSYDSLENFFEAKNYITLFFSVGKLNLRSPFKSKKISINNSGYIYSFSSIKRDGENLEIIMSEIYKESVYLFEIKIK